MRIAVDDAAKLAHTITESHVSTLVLGLGAGWHTYKHDVLYLLTTNFAASAAFAL